MSIMYLKVHFSFFSKNFRTFTCKQRSETDVLKKVLPYKSSLRTTNCQLIELQIITNNNQRESRLTFYIN